MATTFNIPSSPKRSTFEIDNFLGVDLTNTGANVSTNMSPNAPNMIRDVPGKVRKRMGYHTTKQFSENEPIYGAHVIKDTTDLSDLYAQNRFKGDYPTTFTLEPGSSYYLELYEPIASSNKYCMDIVYSRNNTSVALTVSTITETGYESRTYLSAGEANRQYHFKRTHVENGCYGIRLSADETVTVTIHSAFICHEAPEEPVADADAVYKPTPESLGQPLDPTAYYHVKDELIIDIPQSEYKEITSYSVLQTESNRELRIYDSGDLLSFDNPIVGKPVYMTINISTGYTNGFSKEPNFLNEYYIIVSDIGSTVKRYVRIGLSATTTAKSFSIVAGGENIQIWGVRILEKLWAYSNFGLEYRFYKSYVKDAIPYSRLRNREFNTLFHVGSNLYYNHGDTYELLYAQMNKTKSHSWQFGDYLYIVDGLKYLAYSIFDNRVFEVYGSDLAYVPLVTIGKSLSGGGTSYEPLNMLNPWFEESFYVSTATYRPEFNMSFTNLDDIGLDQIEIYEMQETSNGVEFVRLTDLTYYGLTSFSAGIIVPNITTRAPLISGEDNYKIRVKKTITNYKTRINKCKFGTMFGVNGESDRLFISGNPDLISYDWHSEYKNPAYFPDDGYSVLGNETSAVKGYSKVNNYLATHKDSNDPQQAVVIRTGELNSENKGIFRIINSLQGEGAVATDTFSYLGQEPLFLTKNGIFAITASDVTGDKYSQNRSFYLNGELIKEETMKDAYSIVYHDMYWLFINSNVYILDGLQILQTADGAPYSTRQYVGFKLTNIPALIAWENNDKLLFGTADGKICEFYTDVTNKNSYNDNGQAIESWWETPDFDGNIFFKNKTFRYIAVRLKSSIKTTATLYSMTRGLWTLIKQAKTVSNNIFMFSNFSFSGLTFNHDKSDQVISSKLRVKKIDKARFKIEDNNLNEPFGIQNIALEYVQGGNFKG